MKTRKIYLAGPLFSLAEREFNNRLVEAIRRKAPEFEFILPQTYAKEISGQQQFAMKILDYCIKSIRISAALLCLLDGPDADSGTCIEMGYAYAHGKPIIGIRTDFRSSEDQGVNLMVSGVCHTMIWLHDTGMTIEHLADRAVQALKTVPI